MVLIPFGEWMPDQAALNNQGSNYVMNVLPVTEKDYGPFPGMADYSSALTARCQGAASYNDANANVYQFAGDINDLYLMTASTAPNFTKVSKATSPYSVPSSGFWKFTQYGNYVIATDFTDPIQVYTLGTSTAFSDLAVGANATITATIGGTITNGDTVSLTITNATVLSTAQTLTYNVATGNTTSTIAAGLETAINSNTLLAAAGITATVLANVITIQQAGQIGNSTSVTSSITGSKTETVTLSNSGMLTGGKDNAPRAAYATIIRNFLVVGNTYDPAGGLRPQRIWWSGIGDPTSWPAIGSQQAYNVQSDLQDIYGDYGAITGIVSDLGTADGAVFFQRAVVRINYLGPPAIFSILPAENIRGTSAPGSIVQFGSIVYYHADDGFYAFDGTNSEPIGFNKVDQWFKTNADPNYVNDMVGGVDPLTGNIYWSFVGTGSGSINNLTIIYSTKLNKWSVSSIGSEAFSRGLSFGYDIEELNAFGTLEQIVQPLDSTVWAGNRLQLQSFDPANHQMAYLNAANLMATLETTEIEPFEGYKAYVTNIRPIIDGGTPSVALGYRFRQEDSPVYNSPVTMNSIGMCPQRGNGQYFRARAVIPAASNWNHAIGIEAMATQLGTR